MIRHYCALHSGGIFDVQFLHRQEFSTYDESSYRKYVSRLVEEGLLTPISKGVYFIGKSLPSNLDSIIVDSYKIRLAFYGKESFLFDEGIIESKPIITTLYMTWSFGNKKVGNVQIIRNPNAMVLGKEHYVKQKLLELINCQKLIDEDDKGNYAMALAKYTSEYIEPREGSVEYNFYPRSTYIELANLLDKLNISNRVMQVYENNSKLHNQK